MTKVRIRVRDRRAIEVLGHIDEAANAGKGVDVGVISESGASETYEESDISVGLLAEIHELGLGVPRRSWLRDWTDEALDDLAEVIEVLFTEVVFGRVKHEVALERLGAWIQGQIQQRIADGIDPENAESTIERKGSSTPLIDTGQFRSSISYRVK